jgi:cystathionine beta-synthase/cysteine synthase A
MARYIIEDAQIRGLIKPGGTIVEATSGNTGAAIAMIAARKGYHAILTVPDKVSKEKVVACPISAPPDSPRHYERAAKRLAKMTPNSFFLDQHNNPKNAEAHYHTTGREIWQQTGGAIDYFVASAGTGGTISGVGKFLKEKNPRIKVILIDPVGSVYYDFFKTGKVPASKGCTYKLEGIGGDQIPRALDFSVVDEAVRCADKDAFITACRLAKEEGILAGGSSGANVWGALRIAKSLRRKATIVTVLPDGGVKYLSKLYNDEWMENRK